MKRCLGSLLLATLLAWGCDDDVSGPVQPFAGMLVWVQSEGGITGQVRTPLTEGVSVRLEFDGRRVRAFRDGVLVDEARYTAVELPVAGPLPVFEVEYSEPLMAFPFASLDEHTARRIAPAVVQFIEPCCDRYTHTLADSSD